MSNQTNKNLPNLIGCGAGKSGTTSLYYYLIQHPQVFMAPDKEVHFFSNNYAKGEDWYSRHFAGHNGQPIIGEFSTSYLTHPDVPRRIADLTPNVYLLFILRNPIERAFSNYLFSLSIGTQDPKTSFSEVIRNPDGHEKYVVPGMYFDHLSRYLRFFSRKQIHVLLTEDLKKDPIRAIHDCYFFLGIDTAFVPDVRRDFNVTITPSSSLRMRVDRTWLRIKFSIKPNFLWIPSSFRRQFSQIEDRFRRQIVNASRRPSMLQEDVDFLSNIYHRTNRQLAQFLDRGLQWN